MPRTGLPPDEDIDDAILTYRARGWSPARVRGLLRISPSTYKRRVKALRASGRYDRPDPRPRALLAG